ncbi:MAG: hypothetical protein EBE86_030120 [Hormoscilla sp. GUM202]|nr:hypothetical protein [Hormoscilla sp. GUM202]
MLKMLHPYTYGDRLAITSLDVDRYPGYHLHLRDGLDLFLAGWVNLSGGCHLDVSDGCDRQCLMCPTPDPVQSELILVGTRVREISDCHFHLCRDRVPDRDGAMAGATLCDLVPDRDGAMAGATLRDRVPDRDGAMAGARLRDRVVPSLGNSAGNRERGTGNAGNRERGEQGTGNGEQR